MKSADRQDILNVFLASIKDEEDALERLSNTLLGAGYIVECEGVYLTFTVENGKAFNPVHCAPHRCMRFTQADAERVAAQVKNGRGTRGRAVHVVQALRESIDKTRECLKFIQAEVPTNG
jgi:hypothetical protein